MRRRLLDHHEAADLHQELLEGVPEAEPVGAVQTALHGAGEAGEGGGQPLPALALGLTADQRRRQLAVLLLPPDRQASHNSAGQHHSALYELNHLLA